MRLGADAQEQHVKGRDVAVVTKLGCLAQLIRVPFGRCLRIVSVRTVGRRHGVDERGIEIDMVEQRLAGLGLVSLRVARGKESFVPPPDGEPPPVNGISGRRRGDGSEGGGSHATAGQHDRRMALRRLRVHDSRDEPSRNSLREQLLVAVDDHCWRAHGTTPILAISGHTAP